MKRLVLALAFVGACKAAAPVQPQPVAPPPPFVVQREDLHEFTTQVLEAAAHRDFEALEALMDEPFETSADTDASPPVVLSTWRQAPAALDELVTLLDGSCGFYRERALLTCPGDATAPARVLFQQGDDGWHWTGFVSSTSWTEPQ